MVYNQQHKDYIAIAIANCLGQRCPTGGPRATSGPPTLPIRLASVRNHSKPSNDSSSPLWAILRNWLKLLDCVFIGQLRITVAYRRIYHDRVICKHILQADSFLPGKRHLSNDEFWRLVSGERFPKLPEIVGLRLH